MTDLKNYVCENQMDLFSVLEEMDKYNHNRENTSGKWQCLYCKHLNRNKKKKKRGIRMDKVLLSTGNDDWETPKDLYEELDKEFNFTLDPCSNDKNHKCDKFYTMTEDGLKQDWRGETVFCNPPYSKRSSNNPGQEAWIRKCYEESLKEGTTVVMLLPARTDTKAFHQYIYHNAEIRFLKGRVKFLDNGVAKYPATFPSMVVVFK